MNCPFCGEIRMSPGDLLFYQCNTYFTESEPEGDRSRECYARELSQLRTALAECQNTSDTYKKYAEDLRDQLDTSQAELAECQAREVEAREIAKIYRGVKYEHPCGCEECQKLQDRHMALDNLEPISKVLISQAELEALRELEAQVRHCRAHIIHDRIRQALSKLDEVREGK